VEANNSSVRAMESPTRYSFNRYAVSGGFAIVQPNSSLSINAVEGYPLEDFSAEAVRSQIAEAQKIAGGSGSEQDIAEAKIELEVSRDGQKQIS
jgi:F0F1-type ATP synthase epsilon subunit